MKEGTANRPIVPMTGRRGFFPSNLEAIRRTASDLKYALLGVTSTIDEISSGSFPDLISNAFPVFD